MRNYTYSDDRRLSDANLMRERDVEWRKENLSVLDLSRALSVLLFNERIRPVLEAIDPQAVMQARSALQLDEKHVSKLPSIRRSFRGGAEEVGFTDFARYVVQDSHVALEVAERMLAGHSPYVWNEGEPQFYETFEVINAELLREQIGRIHELGQALKGES